MPKLSELQAAPMVNNADLIPIVQGGETKNISAEKVSSLKAIGVNQTWQDVTASRIAGVTYTNTTGKPIVVSVRGGASSTPRVQIVVDSKNVAYVGIATANTDNRVHISAIVPNNSTYAIYTDGAPVSVLELR